MRGEEQVPLLPWWRGFKGEIKLIGKGKYEVCGVAKRVSDTTVEISELPIHKWTQSFKLELEAMITGEKVAKDKDAKDDDDDDKKKDKPKLKAGLIKVGLWFPPFRPDQLLTSFTGLQRASRQSQRFVRGHHGPQGACEG